MNNCIFCNIISGDEPRHHIWEDDHYAAFLDRKPVNPGHVLIVPRLHIGYVFDLPDELYDGLFRSARRLEPALRKATQAKKIGLAIEGFGVDHVHLHVIPMYGGHELDPHRAKLASEEELRTMAEKIKQQLTT